MIQRTVKQVDSKVFVGFIVTQIKIGPQMISLCFAHDKQIDMITHWELVNTKNNTLLDKAVNLKEREQFLLFKIVQKRLLSFTKDQYQAEFIFEDGLKLIVT